MNRPALLCAVALSLSACATTDHTDSPGQMWRPAHASGPAWSITGAIDRTADLSGTHALLSVAVDGVPAVRGYLGAGYNGELTGAYDGHAVDVLCSGHRASADWIDIRCLVLVDNERAVTLTF